jgi:thioredoxin-dependent peroxiredoxin
MTILRKFLIKAAKHVAFEKHHTKLKAGDKAPAIHGILHDGTEFDAKNYKGKKIVLYFYPKDSTPACTAQACSLRDNYKAMLKAAWRKCRYGEETPELYQKIRPAFSAHFRPRTFAY